MAWSTTVVITIWAACLALLIQAVGFAIPFWISTIIPSTTTGDFGVYVGIWYVMACVKGESDSCKSSAIEPKFTTNASYENWRFGGTTQEIIVTSASLGLGYFWMWSVIQIVTTVAIGFVLVACLILICCRCAGIHSKGLFVISCILLFFGGLIGILISVLLGIGLAVIFDFVEGGVTAETFPWSVLLFAIGSLLAFVASIVFMVITCRWEKYGYSDESDKSYTNQEEPLAMTDLSKSYNRGHDNPRYQADVPRNGYMNDRDRYQRDYSSSKKYNDAGNRGSSREHREYRDYDRQYDRAYDRGYEKPNYYSQSRQQSADNMYRPYAQNRY